MGKTKRRRVIRQSKFVKQSSLPQALKPALDNACRKLDMQISKLDQANERFTQKDKALFAKLVNAYTQHDQAHANIYATELAEIRKMGKLIMNARLALRPSSTKNTHSNRAWRRSFCIRTMCWRSTKRKRWIMRSFT